MKFNINRTLYSKEVLLKAAYHFTDNYYIMLDLSQDNYLVNIVAKEGETPETIEYQFSNELIAQSTRAVILEKTSSIRELILARAFASTIIEDNVTTPIEQDANSNADESLFKDWFQK